jgi:MFS family permease
MMGPFAGGLLIDNFGWKGIFAPVIALGFIAMVAVTKIIPGEARAPRRLDALRSSDWLGQLLLSLGVAGFVGYLSSRPLTDVPAFQDLRLLLASVILLLLFAARSKRSANPLVPLSLLRVRNFAAATFCSTLRMFAMGAFAFLVALYLRDIYGLSASAIGAVLTVHYLVLFVLIWRSGKFADRWGSRWIVFCGILVQASALVYFALLREAQAMGIVVIGLVLHAMGAGAYLAPAHRSAMGHVPAEKLGAAAGFYSMVRYSGTLLGPALSGVLLHSGVIRLGSAVAAYQRVFWVIAGVAACGSLVALLIEDR